MAVSTRPRYEVMRSDSFTCRCCGAIAPDVKNIGTPGLKATA